MLGLGVKFIINILQVGAIVLLFLAVVWASVQLFKLAITLVAPAIGQDAKEILGTIRSWMPKLPKWKKRKGAK